MGALQQMRDGIGAKELFGGSDGTLPLLRKSLSKRELMPLLGMRIPHTMIPSKFLGLFTLNMGHDGIIQDISERISDDLVSEILRVERLSLREERKRPWSIKTRRPFRGRMDSVEITFKEKLGLAERVVEEIGAPWKESKRGRPSKFDPKKSSACLLAKGGLSFTVLRGEMRNIEYDATRDGSSKIPSRSYLHHILDKKMDREWLERALERLEDMVFELYSKFNEDMNTFVIDGSSLTCEVLVERMVAMERKLIREIHPYSAIVRTWTNTIRGIGESTNRIDPFLPLIPPHSKLLLDPEYDVDVNYWTARENGIEIHIKQRKGSVKMPGRRMGRKSFNPTEYRKRKLGERHFGNIEIRGHTCHYKKEENRHKGILIIACEHNMIAYFKSRMWCDQFIA